MDQRQGDDSRDDLLPEMCTPWHDQTHIDSKESGMDATVGHPAYYMSSLQW